MNSHNCKPNRQQRSAADQPYRNTLGVRSKGFNAPDEAGGPGFLGGQRGTPEGEDLRALVDALETFLGFGDRFDGGDPKLFDERSVQGDADALPAVFHAQDGAGQYATETKIVAAGGRFKEAVGLGGRE